MYRTRQAHTGDEQDHTGQPETRQNQTRDTNTKISSEGQITTPLIRQEESKWGMKKMRREGGVDPVMMIDRERLRRRSGLLAQDRLGLAHDGILARHPPPERALDLGSQGQFVQVVRLLICGHKALHRQGLVLQAIQAIREGANIGQSGVAAGQAGVGTFGGSERGATADGGKALGVAVLGEANGVSDSWIEKGDRVTQESLPSGP